MIKINHNIIHICSDILFSFKFMNLKSGSCINVLPEHDSSFNYTLFFNSGETGLTSLNSCELKYEYYGSYLFEVFD